MSPPLDFRFVMSADAIGRLPESDAEVAFAGRSNVGKSSLINALANRKGLAHVSKTPGRTQLLNCFAVDGDGGERRWSTSLATATRRCQAGCARRGSR